MQLLSSHLIYSRRRQEKFDIELGVNSGLKSTLIKKNSKLIVLSVQTVYRRRELNRTVCQIPHTTLH
jgi:hypothetical protein